MEILRNTNGFEFKYQRQLPSFNLEDKNKDFFKQIKNLGNCST